MSIDFSQRWAWAEVNLGLIQHNVAVIAQRIAPTDVWAVVKANGYGHGSVPVAQAALAAGAKGLCVAIVDEGVLLRRSGVQAPILVLSEQPAEMAELLVGYALTPTVTTTRGAAAIAAAAQTTGRDVGIHIKVDTGMHRMGAQPSEVLGIAQYASSHPQVTVEGVYTHFAVADEPSHPANVRQLDVFRDVLDRLAGAGINPPVVHAANSAAALVNPDSRFTMARIGIATYGLLPGRGVEEECRGLIPAMSLKARVSAVRWVEAGEAVSYGLRTPVSQQTLIATVPIGYADGVPRRLGAVGASVLVNGTPRRIAGTVTMDQLMVDCGNDSSVSVGDEVVLLGRQGDHTVTADDWAEMTDTIGYEIVCGVSPRVFRRYA